MGRPVGIDVDGSKDMRTSAKQQIIQVKLNLDEFSKFRESKLHAYNIKVYAMYSNNSRRI